jgi:hypothetical protein
LVDEVSGGLASETAGTFARTRFIDSPFPHTATFSIDTSDAVHAYFVMAVVLEQPHV